MFSQKVISSRHGPPSGCDPAGPKDLLKKKASAQTEARKTISHRNVNTIVTNLASLVKSITIFLYPLYIRFYWGIGILNF
jgi:hypothetical protein